jgi:hypothetical protein
MRRTKETSDFFADGMQVDPENVGMRRARYW